MATTTNFGWETPDDTDLVKDGAAAMRTLGNAIDTSLVDLKGGTTGQVLSKASNTDMDFTWVAQDDSNAIQNTIVDAKGDIITATAADTPARLAVGTSGNILAADSSTATGLAYVPTFFAGKNCIINGDFAINQRSFSSSTSAGYGFDRWIFDRAGGTVTYSAQTFTAGTAPVSGYEAANFARVLTSGQSGTGDLALLSQRIENVRTLAGQTATISFWAKAASGTPKIGVEMYQQFGTGGSPSSDNSIPAGAVTISTSWARYSVTVAITSLSGKTVGTTANTSRLDLNLWVSAGTSLNTRASSIGVQNNTFDIWGVQVEAGSTATQFQTATGTIQGELAACQRYYEKSYNTDVAPATTTDVGAIGMFQDGSTSTNNQAQIFYKVTKRGTPTLTIYSAVGGATGNVYNNKTAGNAAATQLYNGASNGSIYANVGTSGTGLNAKFHYVAELEL